MTIPMNNRLEKLRKPYLIPNYGTVLINYDRSKNKEFLSSGNSLGGFDS